MADAIRRGARTNPNARYEARYKQVKLQTMYVSMLWRCSPNDKRYLINPVISLDCFELEVIKSDIMNPIT